MAESERGEKDPVVLDSAALEVIIDGVASKLREKCARAKPGEHSGSASTSTPSGSSGE